MRRILATVAAVSCLLPGRRLRRRATPARRAAGSGAASSSGSSTSAERRRSTSPSRATRSPRTASASRSPSASRSSWSSPRTRPGEIHVHSSPEQELEYDAGTTTLRAEPIDQPGIVDVESHALEKTIVQLEVR